MAAFVERAAIPNGDFCAVAGLGAQAVAALQGGLGADTERASAGIGAAPG